MNDQFAQSASLTKGPAITTSEKRFSLQSDLRREVERAMNQAQRIAEGPPPPSPSVDMTRPESGHPYPLGAGGMNEELSTILALVRDLNIRLETL